ncbi:GNAT family N-acetyltransferase [Saccharothrix hoggarensis]|uniref:GNAT family N-acetyltransferase n=1 Tax=Saccharothrix hoggarensis TaxID=913853 RepID=A0ABW3R1F4_9PSEU
MRYRRLTPADWRTWRDIRLTALRSDPDAFGSTLAREQEYDEARWRELMAPRNGVKVIAVETSGSGAAEPVALVAGVPHEDDAETLYLYSMWVRPEFRRQGVGEAMVANVLAWAREHGWTRVELRVFRDNPVARRLYARLGFVGEGEVMDHPLS